MFPVLALATFRPQGQVTQPGQIPPLENDSVEELSIPKDLYKEGSLCLCPGLREVLQRFLSFYLDSYSCPPVCSFLQCTDDVLKPLR